MRRRKMRSSFAYRRARPGGGVTKQLQGGPAPSFFLFFFRLQAEEKEEREVCRVAFGSCQSWPRRHEADGGQEPTVGLVPNVARLREKPLILLVFLILHLA